MASPDRNAVEPPYDDHLMFGDAEEHEETRGRPLLVLLGMIVIAAFASVIWVAYNQGIKQARDGQPPVLADDSGPARIVPSAGVTPAPDTTKSTYAQVEPDMTVPAPAPAETQLAPAPEEPQAIVSTATPDAVAPVADSFGASPTASPPAAPQSVVAETAVEAPPVDPTASAAVPPAMTGEGGPLAATEVIQPRQRARIQPTPPATPAPVTEGAPDSTVDTFARPRAGADAMAGLPAAIAPSEAQSSAASPVTAVDPLTPSATPPTAAGAPRQLPVPVEPQPTATPPAELTAAPTVLPELGPPADAETPRVRAAPPLVPAKPAKPKVVAEAAPAPAAPKTDILDEPFSGQPTGQPTAAASAQPPSSAGNDVQVAAVAPQAAEPAAAAAATPAAGGFVVQLGSYMSDADAASSWARIKSSHGNTLDGAAPEIRAVDLGAKGTRYRLRVGAYSARGEASQICSRLKASGQDCVVAAR